MKPPYLRSAMKYSITVQMLNSCNPPEDRDIQLMLNGEENQKLPFWVQTSQRKISLGATDGKSALISARMLEHMAQIIKQSINPEHDQDYNVILTKSNDQEEGTYHNDDIQFSGGYEQVHLSGFEITFPEPYDSTPHVRMGDKKVYLPLTDEQRSLIREEWEQRFDRPLSENQVRSLESDLLLRAFPSVGKEHVTSEDCVRCIMNIIDFIDEKIRPLLDKHYEWHWAVKLANKPKEYGDVLFYGIK